LRPKIQKKPDNCDKGYYRHNANLVGQKQFHTRDSTYSANSKRQLSRPSIGVQRYKAEIFGQQALRQLFVGV